MGRVQPFGSRFITLSFCCPLRSSERGSTLRVSHLPLTTAAQKTCRPVPPPPCKCLRLNHGVLVCSLSDWQLRLDRQTQHMRNVAEELDPTFQARRRSPDSGGSGQTGSLHRQTQASEWNLGNNSRQWFTSCPFQHRVGGSVSSLNIIWHARSWWGAHIHPTHQTANRQSSSLKTQREEGKLQTAIISLTRVFFFFHLLCLCVWYLMTLSVPLELFSHFRL